MKELLQVFLFNYAIRDFRKLNCSRGGRIDQENHSWRQVDETDQGGQDTRYHS